MVHNPVKTKIFLKFDFSKIRSNQVNKCITATLTFLLFQNAWCYDFTCNGLYYTKKGTDSCEVTYDSSYKDNFETLVVPSEIYVYTSPSRYTKYYVTSIGESAFKNCSNLKEVYLPNTITKIGEKAFYCCYNIQTLSLGNSITSIGDYAFLNCNYITNIDLGSKISYIGVFALGNCTNVKWIECSAVNPPEITNTTFHNYNPIVIVPNSKYQTAEYWSDLNISGPYSPIEISFESAGFNYEIISVPDQTCRVYDLNDGSTSDYIIPSTVEFKNREFSVTNLTGLFFNQKDDISLFVIPSSIKEVSTKTSIFNSSIESLIVEPSYNKTIDSPYTILKSNIKKAQLGRNVNIFYNDNIDTLSIAKEVTSFSYTLSDNNITNLVIEDADASIKFAKTPLACSDLQNIYLGRNISGSYFKEVTSLKTITFGEKVTAIEKGSFDGCENIETITSLSTTPPVLNCVCSNTVYLSATVKVPAEAISEYQQADGWKYFWNIEPIEDTSYVNSIIASDSDGPAETEYFTLQGVKVMGEPASGLYIRKQGSKIDKITIR